jgi:hypothetical protein
MYILGKGGLAASILRHINNENMVFEGFISLDSDIPILFTPSGVTKPFHYPEEAEFVLGTSSIPWRTRFLTHLKDHYPLSTRYFPNLVINTDLALAHDIGIGNVFMPFSLIENRAVIGDFNLLKSYSNVEYNSTVGNYNVLDSYANIRHNTTIGNSNYIASKACIGKELIVGSYNVIECGECLFEDMQDNELFQSGIITNR